MASPSTFAKTTTFALPRLRDLIEHDDEEDDDLVEEEEEDDEEEEEDWDIGKRMSRLSVAGSDGGDANDEDDGGGDDEEDEEEVRSDGVQGDQYGSQPWHPYGSPGNLNPPSSASLPGTPDRGAPSQSPWGRGYSKDYASETEAAWWPGGSQDMRRQQHRRQRMMREVWLDRAWQMRKQRQQRLGERGVNEVTVLVGKGGGDSPVVAMDMEEVRACKDLGFDLPRDWTVEIPSYAVPNADTGSSGGNSPAGSGSWRISSPGDDPKEVKARLKVWAQAVALTSASRLGS